MDGGRPPSGGQLKFVNLFGDKTMERASETMERVSEKLMRYSEKLKPASRNSAHEFTN